MRQEDSVKSLATFAVRTTAFAAATFVFFSPHSSAQDASQPGTQQGTTTAAPADTAGAVRDLQNQVRQLHEMVEEMRAENAQSRSEMQKLRQDLQATRALLEGSGPAGAPASWPVVASAAPAESTSPAMASGDARAATPQAHPQANPALEDRVQKLEDTAALLGSKIDEQYQTKVESASKYRARLHGIVLMNAFHTVGNPDNLDLPTFAQQVPNGFESASSGATLRQSEIGLEAFGPNVGGAKTSADVQLDFAGGFPNTGNGVNFGIVRLQTANIRFDWEHTSIVAGQDSLFISPLTPTSFASLAIPTFAFAGNLWGWTPQLRVEQRFSLSDEQTVSVQAGIIDNLDWHFPSQSNPFLRTPQAGEMTGQPAYAVRTAWSRPVNGHPLTFGAAGYYGRQAWTWSRYTDSWAGMLDWEMPLPGRFGISGEFYRGRGIGGLGGAAGQSAVFGGNGMQSIPSNPVRALDAIGGWAQLKFRLAPKVELNGVVADDNAFAGDVRGFAFNGNSNFASIIGRNQGALANVIFRPRSDLLLAAEFRRLHTFPVYSSSSIANQVNLSVGILF
jgi:hypothetical protein